VHLLADQGSEGIPLELDVADEASIKRGLLDDRLPGPVEILVNNAGLSRPGPALQLPTVDWDAVFATNLRGGFLLARAVAEALIDAGKPGNIINVCSVLGRSPQKGVMPYAASKAGLLHVTRLLALEWARYGIRVNALVPGFFRTSITASYLDSAAGRSLVQRIPQRRAGAIDELAWPLLLLASDASAYMTGAELVVDGGLSVNPL
jgi:NAD(P)-dependent dehydrogenase (short-subunit alcohol dehydrogenase family)